LRINPRRGDHRFSSCRWGTGSARALLAKQWQVGRKQYSPRDVVDGAISMDDVQRRAAGLGLRDQEIPTESGLERWRRTARRVLQEGAQARTGLMGVLQS